MSNLLAMSFDMPVSPAITLKASLRGDGQVAGGDLPYGWGMGWYPGDEPAAVVIKDPTSIGDSAMSRVLRDWERFRSSTFLCHLRGAAQRITQRDTHPFIRTYAGHHWLMAHNGTLQGDLTQALPLGEDASFEPIGRTDTEHAFCWLLTQVSGAGARSLAECDWARLHDWLQRIDALGTANVLLSDGQSLVVHNDGEGFSGLHWVRITPPHVQGRLESDEVAVTFDGVRDENRTGIVFSTRPLQSEGWVRMSPGQTLVARRGTIVWDSLSVWVAGQQGDGVQSAPEARAMLEGQYHTPLQQPQARQPADVTPRDAPAQPRTPRTPRTPGVPVSGAYAPPAINPNRPGSNTLSIVHETVYRYSAPVENSSHLFRLRPIHDLRQSVQEFAVELSVEGLRREYEDVFGNQVLRLELSAPYTELVIRTRSVVSVTGQLGLRSPHRRDQIPLVWMPWQRQMMLPYLLPPELAESELQELHEFAMSFVERNDYELLETLLDINRTIYRDFSYVSGSTTLSTTPYQVYVSRRGVCQDFANLLICLARLLNVPARYRAGYIYTGAEYENQLQSDASHAWAELYLPWVGWHGFDPTNGCLVGLDHVRVACGRNFQDATPTSGTIYRGGGGESLTVNVKVEQI